MRLIAFLVALWVAAEFRAEVNGRDTLIGCGIRSVDGITDGRCGGATKP